MSETVHYEGKLKPTGKGLYQYIEGDNIPHYYDDKAEYFNDEYSSKATLINNLVFEIEREEKEDDCDIFKSSENEDGTISFEVKYYNGGCGFSEAIDEAIKNKVGK